VASLSTQNSWPLASVNTSPSPADVPTKATINVPSSKRTGRSCERLVGYDRFSGEAALRQLAEWYRALRLYVNIFQPSMKLQSKRREGSHVHRTYDAAQTPLQRLRAAGGLEACHPAHDTATACTRACNGSLFAGVRRSGRALTRCTGRGQAAPLA
jgi:hypothetical protein